MSSTESSIADEFFSDADVHKGKDLLLSALKKAQAKITAVRPPIRALSQSYAETIAQFSHTRGANLWYPYLGSGIGNGALVELADGSIKYDFISGIGVHFFGHSSPKIMESCLDAALKDVVMQGQLQQNIDTVRLSTLLSKQSQLEHCYLTSSGSMAVENGLKIAFQKKFPASRILAFERGFSGRTLALAQVCDKPALRQNLPVTCSVDFIPFFDPAHAKASIDAATNALQRLIARYPGQHAVMVFELVQGEGGCYPGSHAFFASLMQILKAHHIAILIDEVQTFGRTEELFAFQYYGLQEYVDICSIGKLSQICATLFSAEFNPRIGLLGQTFTSSSSAIQSATVIIEHLIEGNFYGPQGKIAQLHAYFEKKLSEMAARCPGAIQGPFGCGGMIGFTLGQKKREAVMDFLHQLFHAGVIAFLAGENPTRVRFLPPMAAIDEKDIDAVLQIVESVLTQIGASQKS